jgi:hypothetical protein
MAKYGIQQGYQFEGDLRRAINFRMGFGPNDDNPHLLTEQTLKEKFGSFINSHGEKIVGVDILCAVDNVVYAIQCKQYKNKVPKRCVEDFIDYCNYLERIIGTQIIKIWSSSQKSTEPGNLLGEINGFKWIIYSSSDALIINTVNWIFEKKFYVDNDGDVLMY